MAEYLTLARPYAKAVFQFAKDSNCFSEWSEALSALTALSSHKEVKSLHNDPNLTKEQLLSFYVDSFPNLLKRNIKESEQNLLKLLIENRRLDLLSEIAQLYDNYVHSLNNLSKVKIISAFIVNEQQKKDLIEKMKNKFGFDVELTCEIDPSLIGGAIVRIGDKIIDGSVKGKLQQMAADLGA